jgi:CelD/BcsL family acetyltransferase involved in cellulose biosynthesis
MNPSSVRALGQQILNYPSVCYLASGKELPEKSELYRGHTLTPIVSDSAKSCEVVTDFARLEQLSSHWVRLWEANVHREIFQDFGWIRAFWKAYGHKMSVCSPVVWQGEKVLGILPLVLQDEALRFLGVPGADYNDLLCEDDIAADVLRIALEELLKLRSSWKNCTFENLSSQSLIVRHVRKLPHYLRKHITLTFGCSCPTIVLGENRPKVITRLLRKESFRRHSNRLQKLGQLVFRHLESRAEIQAHITKFFKQHIERWAMTGRASHFLQQETRHFYEALVAELDPFHQLRFAVLELDGHPIAYHFGFELDKRFIWYQSTFDVAYWEYSPGEVLLGELLRYAREFGLREFDLTIGGEAYKTRFANQSRENFVVYLDGHSNPIRSQLDQTVRHAQGGFRRVKQILERRTRARRVIKQNALRIKTLFGRAHHFLRQESLLRLGLRVATAVIRNAIWARDEMLFFSRTKYVLGTEAGLPTGPEGDLLISKGSLGDLAVLSFENPRFLDRTKLDEYRRRLRGGDQVYIGRQGTDVAVVAWLGARSEITAFELCPRCKMLLDSPALLIYDCKSAPNLREHRVYEEVLAALAREAAIQGIDAFTHSSVLSGASRTKIEEVGFRLRHRMIHLRILHWFHHSWILRAADSLPQPQP